MEMDCQASHVSRNAPFTSWIRVGWIPWANLKSFASWHLTLVVEWLHNSGTDSCACLLTTVPEGSVHAYWQRWQEELCLLTDNGDRISPSVVSTSDTNAGHPEFEARPDRYSPFVKAISWIYSASFGKTWDSTLLRRPFQYTAILSGRYDKLEICNLKPRTSVGCKGEGDILTSLHYTTPFCYTFWGHLFFNHQVELLILQL
jgi:hypothetical protein